MEDVRGKYIPPAVNLTAFSCPHCGALAQQFWYGGQVYYLGKEPPLVISPADAVDWLADEALGNSDKREQRGQFIRQLAAGSPFFHDKEHTADKDVGNLHVSLCFHCKKIALWVYDRMIWPRRGDAPQSHPDLPAHIREDYDEASTILDLSPKGAAALLRLVVQKLCIHLGEKGKRLDDDIASLVKRGLPVAVQQALDVVRVVGNAAVHPGLMDQEDVRATAEELFGLVNRIVEETISRPAWIKTLSERMPESAKQAMEKRDRTK